MRRSLVAALLALLTAPLAAARGGMPEPLTGRGEIVEGIYYPIFLAALIVFVIVMVLLFYVMWRFRANGGSGQATFEIERDNLKLEMLWIIVPLIVVLWVGVISYAGLVELDEGQSQEDAYMTLDVTGYQWTWLADYGSDISLFSDPSATDGSVADDKVFKVPADKAVHYRITGGDVIHAWHMMDENWATVGLVDANPFGPHKYTGFTATLPEGEYQVQCREMCFNPGHGYMRARVEAVPMTEFVDWMEEKGITAGVDLAQPATVAWNGAFESEALTFAAGDSSRAVFTFTNSHDMPVDVAAPGFELMQAVFDDSDGPKIMMESSPSITVPAGETIRFAIDVNAAGDFELQAGGEVLPFEVIEATPIRVDLGDFFIDPINIQLEAGTTYLFQINNIGATSHNFFFGTKTSVDDAGEIVGESITIGGGASTSLLYTPDVAMNFDTWCAVPGHYGLGMFGTMAVQ